MKPTVARKPARGSRPATGNAHLQQKSDKESLDEVQRTCGRKRGHQLREQGEQTCYATAQAARPSQAHCQPERLDRDNQRKKARTHVHHASSRSVHSLSALCERFVFISHSFPPFPQISEHLLLCFFPLCTLCALQHRRMQLWFLSVCIAVAAGLAHLKRPRNCPPPRPVATPL